MENVFLQNTDTGFSSHLTLEATAQFIITLVACSIRNINFTFSVTSAVFRDDMNLSMTEGLLQIFIIDLSCDNSIFETIDLRTFYWADIIGNRICSIYSM